MFLWCTSGTTWFWKKNEYLMKCPSCTQFKRSPQSFRKSSQSFLPLTTSVCVKKHSSTTTQESHHQQQRSVMTTTHSGHNAAWAGTIQFVSRGCVQMEVWEVKGRPVFMCACHDLVDSRSQSSKVPVKCVADAKAKKAWFWKNHMPPIYLMHFQHFYTSQLYDFFNKFVLKCLDKVLVAFIWFICI